MLETVVEMLGNQWFWQLVLLSSWGGVNNDIGGLLLPGLWVYREVCGSSSVSFLSLVYIVDHVTWWFAGLESPVLCLSFSWPCSVCTWSYLKSGSVQELVEIGIPRSCLNRLQPFFGVGIVFCHFYCKRPAGCLFYLVPWCVVFFWVLYVPG